MKTHAGLERGLPVVQEGYRRGDSEGSTRIFQATSPRRNATFCYSGEHIARDVQPRAREHWSNDRAMNARITVDRVRRAISRKIEHFSGNPGAPRRVAPRDSFRLRSDFGPVSADAADVSVVFSRHSSIIRATKRALFQIFAPTNRYLSPMQLRASRARERAHVRRAYTGAVSFESFVEFPSYQDGM
jgi:hypothetical protein